MDLFNEIDDVSDLFMLDRNTKLDTAVEGYQDLQTKYTNLHESYSKEIENSKKVEKCLAKCLKFYSKLSKKYEAQQKIIASLEERIKEKVASLEESLRTQEKMKGLIEVYQCERSIYSGTTNESLRKDKEVLLEICCRLIRESVKTNNIKSLTNLILRKFRKDLDDNKLNLLKEKNEPMKKESDSDLFEDLKFDLNNFKSEKFTQLDEHFWETKPKEEKNCDEINGDVSNCEVKGDLSETEVEKSNKCSHEVSSPENIHKNDKMSFPDVRDRHLESTAGGRAPCDLPVFDEEIYKDQESNSLEPVKRSNEKIGHNEYTLAENSVFEGRRNNKTEVSVSPSGGPLLYGSLDKSSGEGYQSMSKERPRSPVKLGCSIFDIPDISPKENYAPSNQISHGCEISSPEKSNLNDGETSLCFGAPLENQEPLAGDSRKSTFEKSTGSDLEDIPKLEEKLSRIFSQMSFVRILSPVKDLSESRVNTRTSESTSDFISCNGSHEKVFETPEGKGMKRNFELEEPHEKVKKSKPNGEEGANQGNCNLLDSILSAMSIQSKELKQNVISVVPMVEENSKMGLNPAKVEDCSMFVEIGTRTSSRRNKAIAKSDCRPEETLPFQTVKVKPDKIDKIVEKVVMDELKNFVCSPMTTKEEADKNVKQCISFLANKSEEIIARSIVVIVLENVDEDVEMYERPAPPLTKTQHRLMVLLSVFRTLDLRWEKMTAVIMSMIAEKLFPDNFFWPDDCVESACRFYTALCKGKNDAKALWKFCLQAMTEMKQRSCLVVFTALKTWPDVLHDATTLKNNVLAVTIANVFLHMPKSEGLRNLNQKKKLMALKHLLMNFYQFKVEDTIEEYAGKVLESVVKGEVGSEKSLVLLSKCRDRSWTGKHVLPKLRTALGEWEDGRIGDSAASRILAVIKQIAPVLGGTPKMLDAVCHVKDIVSCLTGIVASGKLNHESELHIMNVLLELKQYPEARRVIREWVPKGAISESLRNEIVCVSAENVFRELKLNPGKGSPEKRNFKKQFKKHSIKSNEKKKKKKKKKKEKGGRRRSNERRVPPTPGVA